MAAGRAPKRRKLSDDAEIEYVRKTSQQSDNRLPRRTPAGWQPDNLHPARSPSPKPEQFLEEIRPSAPTRQPQELSISEAKEVFSRIASDISEAPVEAISKLSQLQEHGGRSRNVNIRRLALATQLAVLKDVIPGYRVRPAGKDETRQSKEVRQLRSFETTLLRHYKEYVDLLSRLVDDREMRTVAIGCVSTLLTTAPHFNHRNDLIAIVVRQISTRELDTNAQRCLSALQELLRTDEEGHASLEVVSQLTRTLKSRNYQVHHSVIDAFLHLRLLSEYSPQADGADQAKQKTSKKSREFRTKRERKIAKERKAIEGEMKEADALVGFEERDKNQGETLKMVFVIYFRILKTRVEHLMGSVLQGLAKYSHLINQHFFGDVLEVLKELITEAESSGTTSADDENDLLSRNRTKEVLLCIITALDLLKGQEKAANSLKLDLGFFYDALYQSLISSSLDPENELLLLKCLERALGPQMPPARLEKFTKRTMTAALQLSGKASAASLSLLNPLAGKVGSMWDAEAASHSETAWESVLLKEHYDQGVRAAVGAVEKKAVAG